MSTLSRLNVTLLVLNGIVLTVLLVVGMIQFDRNTPTWVLRPLPKDMATDALVGWNSYCDLGPIVLLVNKGFPQNASFSVRQRDVPIELEINDAHVMDKEGVATKLAELNLENESGLGVSMICYYALSNGQPQARMATLNLSRPNNMYESLTDYNLDGVWDDRQLRNIETNEVHNYVLLAGVWREIARWNADPDLSRLDRRLVDGPRVAFDMDSGKWKTKENPRRTSEENPAVRN